MNTVLSVTGIPAMPYISGSVQVSLADLDKMRTDHVAAVNIARELQNNQMKVVVVLKRDGKMETEWTHEPRGYGAPRDVKRPDEILSTEYRNLDDVRLVIRDEELAKVDEELKNKDSVILNLRGQHVIDSNRVNEIRAEKKELSAALAATEEELAHKSALLKTSEESHSKYYDLYRQTQKDYEKLFNQKSIIQWIASKF